MRPPFRYHREALIPSHLGRTLDCSSTSRTRYPPRPNFNAPIHSRMAAHIFVAGRHRHRVDRVAFIASHWPSSLPTISLAAWHLARTVRTDPRSHAQDRTRSRLRHAEPPGIPIVSCKRARGVCPMVAGLGTQRGAAHRSGRVARRVAPDFHPLTHRHYLRRDPRHLRRDRRANLALLDRAPARRCRGPICF